LLCRSGYAKAQRNGSSIEAIKPGTKNKKLKTINRIHGKNF
jgi:hypothetical protein